MSFIDDAFALLAIKFSRCRGRAKKKNNKTGNLGSTAEQNLIGMSDIVCLIQKYWALTAGSFVNRFHARVLGLRVSY